jgi:hypothetical protein
VKPVKGASVPIRKLVKVFSGRGSEPSSIRRIIGCYEEIVCAWRTDGMVGFGAGEQHSHKLFHHLNQDKQLDPEKFLT